MRAHAAWSAYGTSSGLDHSGWAGIIEANEQVTFAPLSCDRYPPAGHPLPDLPPHRGVPARQPQRGPDRALPPGPSRSARRPFPVTLRRLPALGTVASADCPRTPCTSWAGERQRSRSVATLRKDPHIEPPNACLRDPVQVLAVDARSGRSAALRLPGSPVIRCCQGMCWVFRDCRGATGRRCRCRRRRPGCRLARTPQRSRRGCWGR